MQPKVAMLKSPVGTLTFLMTDVEGSTRLWEEYPAAMTKGIIRHEAIIHKVVSAHDGYHVIEQGEGDSTLSVFKDATQAAQAAEEIRERLAVERWTDGLVIRVRIGLHSGVADMRQQTYYGRAVNRAARVRAVAHGGQVVLTRATRELLDLPRFPQLKDHGRHRLKDLLQPEHLYELPSSETFPPFNTLNSRPNNLPVQLTPFIGRADDISKVQERLAASRIVTLMGPGGCGKTRLALQVAAEVLDRYHDGAFFVDLTSARTHDDVIGAALRATRVDSFAALEHTEMLIVVDNCEHIVQDAAQGLKELLESTHQLKVLATSRQALHLRAESLYRVSPLSLPSRGSLDDVDQVALSEAVQLFVERGEAKLPGFHLTARNCRAIGEICIRLDGIALAIELAVPRLKILSPDEVLSRLDERFKLLKTADRTEVRRHQTLLAAIEYSYDLLSEDERALFRGLAVFRSGWSLAAAEAVAPDSLQGRVLELLEALFDKSLVQVAEDGGPEVRSYLFETVREYALIKLAESGESDQAYERSCRWHIAAASGLRDQIASGNADAVRRLDTIMPNVEEALDWTIRASRPDIGLELGSVVWEHWSRRGTFTQARGKLRSLLKMDGATDFQQALGSSILGTLAWYQNDLDEAQASYGASLSLYEQLGEENKIARAKSNLGLICVEQGDFPCARTYFRQSLRGFEALDQVAGAISAGVNLGTLELDCERHSEAQRVFTSLLPRAEALGDPHQLAMLYCNLAECDLWDSKPFDAATWLLKSVEFLSKEVFPNFEAAHFCRVCAYALACLGQLVPAAKLATFDEEMRRGSAIELTGRVKRRNADLQERLRNLAKVDRQMATSEAMAMDRNQASVLIFEALTTACGAATVPPFSQET